LYNILNMLSGRPVSWDTLYKDLVLQLTSTTKPKEYLSIEH